LTLALAVELFFMHPGKPNLCLHGVLQVNMMLTARFQPRLQSATCCRARTSGRSAVLRVVAFKNGDGDEDQEQKQQMSKTKVTFQLPLHGETGS
jgi:hypothetical protein